MSYLQRSSMGLKRNLKTQGANPHLVQSSARALLCPSKKRSRSKAPLGHFSPRAAK